MYIANPITHDGVRKYISYTLLGTDIQNQPSRRYSDFFALREKLLERWPGIYIPNIPPKKIIGNTDKKNIAKRVRLLNKFCLKLSQYPFLYQSDDVILFQTHGNDVAKAIEKSHKSKIADMLEKYKAAFPDFDESYDLALGRSKTIEYLAFLKRTLKNLTTFHSVVTACVEKRDKEIAQYIELMQQMEEYEKFVLMEYSDNNEGKLILFNPANTLLNEKIVGMDKNLNNPFVALDEWLEEEELDIMAVIEALNSLTKLSQNVEKLAQKIDSLAAELKQLEAGNQGFISGLFKKKEAQQAEVESQKLQTEQDKAGLEMMNRIAHFNMENFFTRFQDEKAKSYYKALKIYSFMQKDDIAYNHELWKEIKTSLGKVNQ